MKKYQMSSIKRKATIRFAIVISLSSLGIIGSAIAEEVAHQKETVTLKLNAPKIVRYQNKDGAQITARYFSLSNGSLDFVKLTMPDGMEYTLPHAVSASGERYTDGLKLVWWIKGSVWKTSFDFSATAPA
jgi:membrane-bound inhibitor of C-type lysozyme